MKHCKRHGKVTDSILTIENTKGVDEHYCGHCMAEMFKEHGLEPMALIITEKMMKPPEDMKPWYLL